MISVIVLSKNSGDTLDKCLRSIIESEGEKEIIVVDAHSTDNTPQILRKYRGKIKVVYDEGKGIGIARNIGVKHSKGDIICFVDADAFVSKDHFTKIKRLFDEHPEVGVVHVDASEALSDDLPYVQRMEAKLRQIRKGSPYALSKGESLLAVGYFLSFRRKVFDDVRGFWEFPPYGADDNDFSMKALLKGWKLGVIKLRSWHRHRTTLKELLRRMFGLGKGKACLIIKWRKNPLFKRVYKNRLLSKLAENYQLLLVTAAYILSPIIAARYAIEARNSSIYPFYVVIQLANFAGFLWGLATWAKKMSPVKTYNS